MEKIVAVTLFTLRFSIADNVIRNVLSPLEQCRLVLHIPVDLWSQSLNSFYQEYLSQKLGGATLVTEADQWSYTMIEKFWDPKSRCVVHLSLHRIMKTIQMVDMFFKFQRKAMAEYEYFVIQVTPMAWLQLTAFGDELLRRLLAFNQNMILLKLGPQPTTFSDEIELPQILHAARAELHCDSNVQACTVPIVSPKSRKSFVDRISRDERRVDFNGWPLHVFWPNPDYPLAPSLQRVDKLPFWYIMRYSSYSEFYLGIAQICSHVGKHLNATLATTNFKEYLPTSFLAPALVLTHFDGILRPLVHSVEYVYFIHCNGPDPPSFQGFIQAYFAPFDTQTWLFLAITVVLLCVLLKCTEGSYYILECYGAVVGEVGRVPGNSRWIFCIWLFGAFLLGSLYTNFIESLVIVPHRAAWLEDFEQLYTAGYTIVLPDSPLEDLDDIFRNSSSKFDGSPYYYQALRQNAEYIPAPNGMDSSEFLDSAFLQPKKAIVVRSNDRGIMLEILKIKFPQRPCGAGKRPWMFDMNIWSGGLARGAVIRGILHQL